MSRTRNKARPAVSTLHLLHRAGLCVEDLFTFFVGFDGPSSRQFAILMAVARGNGASQASIVNATGIDRTTTSDMVRRLAKKGWLQRGRARDDARVFTVRLTATGRKVLKSGEGAARETDQKVLEVLSSARRGVLVKALGKIVEANLANRAIL